MKHNVPIQSLIDHIKTAIDVDPWAKEMAEELLKEQEPKEPVCDEYGNKRCAVCSRKLQSISDPDMFCCKCGQAVKWDA